MEIRLHESSLTSLNKYTRPSAVEIPRRLPFESQSKWVTLSGNDFNSYLFHSLFVFEKLSLLEPSKFFKPIHK